MWAAAATWYAEFMRHMSIQQPANLVSYPNMWPWTYQSQMAAQAMNAAAIGLQAAPGVAIAPRARGAVQCNLALSQESLGECAAVLHIHDEHERQPCCNYLHVPHAPQVWQTCRHRALCQSLARRSYMRAWTNLVRVHSNVSSRPACMHALLW